MKQRAGARALALFFFPGQSGAWCAPPGCRVPVHFCARSPWLAATRLFRVWRATQLDVAWEWRQNSNEQLQFEARSLPASSLVDTDGRRLGVAFTSRRRRLCAPRWPALRCVFCQAAEGTLEDRTTRGETEKLSVYPSCTLECRWSKEGHAVTCTLSNSCLGAQPGSTPDSHPAPYPVPDTSDSYTVTILTS